MVFAALLFLLPAPQNAGASVQFSREPAIAANAPVTGTGAALPDSDAGKDRKTNEEAGKSGDGATVTASTTASAALPSMPVAKASAAEPAAFPVAPIRPAVVAIEESPTQRKVWYALALAGHAGAAFDAWSTRRAISAGMGTEANPMLRPFAHSSALYAATQVSPLVMDFLGKKMMTSQHKWMRKMWWLPQTAGAGISFAAGAHNVGLVQ